MEGMELLSKRWARPLASDFTLHFKGPKGASRELPEILKVTLSHDACALESSVNGANSTRLTEFSRIDGTKPPPCSEFEEDQPHKEQ